MAFLDEAIVALLKANSPINTVVGGRIYPIKAPDNAVMPMITYQRVSNLRESMITGEQPKLTETLFQLDIWVSQYTGQNSGISTLRTISKNVRELLDAYRGTTSGVDIQAIMSENEFDYPWDEVAKIYGVTQRYRIFHRE